MRAISVLLLVLLCASCIVPEGYDVVMPVPAIPETDVFYQGFFVSCFDTAYPVIGPNAAYSYCMDYTRQAAGLDMSDIEIPGWEWPLPTPVPVPTQTPTPAIPNI